MIELKSCPRCQGDMQQTRDEYGMYRQCLQCAYTMYPQQDEPERRSDTPPTRRGKDAA